MRSVLIGLCFAGMAYAVLALEVGSKREQRARETAALERAEKAERALAETEAAARELYRMQREEIRQLRRELDGAPDNSF